MRTTVTLDDDLLATATRYSGIKEKSALLNRALKTFVELEAGRRLARLGGSDPAAWAAPRRRPPDYLNPDPPTLTNAEQDEPKAA